jgi:ABC-type bacteriocin/lantibiotic exporter with double-glycine peptidase domain
MINKSHIQILIQVIRLGFTKYKILYFLSFVSAISILLETIAMSFLSSLSGRRFIIFNDYFNTVNGNLIFIFILFFFVLRFITMYYVESKYIYIARLLQHYLSALTLEKIFNEKLKVIERKEVGYYISMAGDEASKCSEILNSFLRVLNSVIIGVLYFIMILYFDFNFLYVLLVFFIVNAGVVNWVMKKIFRLGNESVVLGRSAASIFLDALNSLRTIKSFGMGIFIHENYSLYMEKYQMTNFRITALSLFNKLFPLISLFLLFDMYVMYDFLHLHKLNVSYLLTIFFMLMRLLTIVGDLLQTTSTVVSNLKLTNDIMSFSSDKKELRTGVAVKDINSLKVMDVDFGHLADKMIFKNLNLNFEKGKSYIIIGKTGSGKSTLLDLIMDFNTPSKGEILINNVNSMNIDEKALTEKILYVGQESMVFNNTIKYNLEIDKKYDDATIDKYLLIADLKNTVDLFDGKLEHLLNYRGTNISGGQKQRLNLVRALLRQPDVLILDESVNALDSNTRITVVSNILEEYKNKIVIIVAHDKDIMGLVDEVIDLDIVNSN